MSCQPCFENHHVNKADKTSYFILILNELKYFEKILCGAAVHGAVFNISLSTQVVRVLNGCFHSLYGEERGQIGRVGGNEYEREKSPCAAHNSHTGRLRVYVGACTKRK